MDYCFVQKTDWKINRRGNSFFQRLKMLFHISAKNLFLDRGPGDNITCDSLKIYQCEPYEVTEGHHGLKGGVDKHDWTRKTTKRDLMSIIRTVLFGISAKDLFEDA